VTIYDRKSGHCLKCLNWDTKGMEERDMGRGWRRGTPYSSQLGIWGLFVPFVKYSRNWCEGVPPGAHPPGCLSNASRPRCKTSYLYVQLWHVGHFLVIMAKPTSTCCLLFHIFLVFVYIHVMKSQIRLGCWQLLCPTLLTSTRVCLIRPVVMAS